MANNGINMGKSNIQAGNLNVTNTVTIKKSHLTLGLTISITVIIVLVLVIINPFGGKGTNILGTWVTDNGDYIEFLSDGTMDTNIHNVRVNPDTYEILDDGYLKWGQYDPGWIQYFYSYWKMEISGDKITLISKENENSKIILTREK